MKFSLRRIWAVILVRNREFYRDLGALGWVILFPLVMVIAFGYIFDLDKTEDYKVGYWGDVRPQSIPHIKWIQYQSQQQSLEKLKLQKIDAAMTVGQKPPIVWFAKGNPRSKMTREILHLHLLPKKPIPFYAEELEGRQMSYIEWLFPGIINLNIMFMGLWGVGWVIVRQRKLGILKRLKASPLTAFEYLLAQMISRLWVMVTSTILVTTAAVLIYPFDFVGSFLETLVVFVLGCLALSSIGLVFAARISSEELCNGLLNFITYPIMFVSEIWFSLEGASPLVKKIATFSPLWHMTQAMRKILYEGGSLWAVKESLFILILIFIFFTTLGSILFKWNSE